MKLFDCIPVILTPEILLKKIEFHDAESIGRLMHNEAIYKYLPTFLLEEQYEDPREVIKYMYEKAFKNKESLFLGIYIDSGKTLVGIAELYGYNPELHLIHLGYRLLEEYWGLGLASKTVNALVTFLYTSTDIEIVAASTLPGNAGSERVLEKNGFSKVVECSDEDWGFGGMTPTTKWVV